jgi:hypothetical protein
MIILTSFDWSVISEPIIVAFTGIIGSLITIGGGYAIHWLQTKIKSDKAKKALDALEELIFLQVTAAQQSTVETLKKEGAWNTQAAKTVLSNVRAKIIKSMSSTMHEALENNYGEDAGSLIDVMIEAAVAETKHYLE